MVAYSSTSDLLSDSNRFRMFARTVPSDKYQCKAMADIIAHYKWSFVSVIYSPELYGREGADELIHLLERKNTFVDKFHPLIESKITDQNHLDQVCFFKVCVSDGFKVHYIFIHLLYSNLQKCHYDCFI